jgi:thiamine biosynthesis lipoprotein
MVNGRIQFGLVFLWILVLGAMSAKCETIVLRGAAQGTTYHIKVVVPSGGVDAERLQADVDRFLGEVDRQMSTYRDDSELSRFNRAAAGEWFDVSPAVVRVVTEARTISEKTGGAIDVTVGPLVRLWHFGPGKAPSPLPSPGGRGSKNPLPTDQEIADARNRVGYQKLQVRAKPQAMRKTVDGLEVDLSSIASGYTIDEIGKLLAGRGVANFMIELGGEIFARGAREDGKPWRAAIERPGVGEREMQAAVPLVNCALATAGGTYRFFEFEGRRYSHVIDPATGRPVAHTLASVTVAADTCIEADGWDTPLLVLGPERGLDCAERNGIAALFIDEEAAGGEAVRTTTAWKKRFGDVVKP